MRRTGLLLMIGVVGVLAALSVGAVAPVPAPESSEIKQLKKEVEALRQRVASLEERLKEDLLVPTPKDGRRTPGFVIPVPRSGQVPPHWREFEFNGMTYYIVPINSAHKLSGEVEKQTPQNRTPAGSEAPDQQ